MGIWKRETEDGKITIISERAPVSFPGYGRGGRTPGDSEGEIEGGSGDGDGGQSEEDEYGEGDGKEISSRALARVLSAKLPEGGKPEEDYIPGGIGEDRFSKNISLLKPGDVVFFNIFTKAPHVEHLLPSASAQEKKKRGIKLMKGVVVKEEEFGYYTISSGGVLYKVPLNIRRNKNIFPVKQNDS